MKKPSLCFKNFILLITTICYILAIVSCSDRKGSGERISKNADAAIDTTKNAITDTNKIDNSNIKYNIYIENSASMDGYVHGNTSLEADLTEMLVSIKSQVGENNININFINSKIYPGKNSFIGNFANQLDEKSGDFTIGGKDRYTSKLNNVINIILDSLKPGHISVLISDCIYSLGKGNDTKGKLNIQKALTHDAFNDALKKDNLTTVGLKMVSTFNGLYYDSDNKPTPFNGLRPYYIWIIGNERIVDDNYEKIIRSLKGIERYYYLSVPGNLSGKKIAKIIRKDKIGDFKIPQSATDLVIFNAVPSEKNSSVFQFTVAVNLDYLKMDEDYLVNPSNYEVPNHYKIKSINKKSDPNDPSLSGYSHTITLYTDDLKQNDSVYIKLKSVLPSWIDSTHNEDDSNIKNPVQQKQTFGIKYFVEGIKEAYDEKYQEKEQFSIYIKVSKSNIASDGGRSSGFPWWIIFTLIIIAGLIIWAKSKK